MLIFTIMNKKTLLTSFYLAMAGLLMTTSFTSGQDTYNYFYQLKIYHLEDETQEKVVEQFLETAYLPALHRAGIPHVGVFKPVEPDTSGRRIYVFIPFPSLDRFQDLEQTLLQDQQYLAAGADYLDAPHDRVPYKRIESILLRAFPDMPRPQIPALEAPKSKRIYELRSYEGPTEKYYTNKVKMFNEGGEIKIFERLNFNAVFYGEVLSGSHMPNLMYMTTFNDRADRDQHWDAFGSDPAWETLKAMEEYQNNVSHSDIFFLYPTAYSDF